MSRTWRAEQGVVYRARAELDDPFGVATTPMVEGLLREQGLSDISVWWSEDSLPSDWPADRREDVSGIGSRQAWIQARWIEKSTDLPLEGDEWRLYDVWPVDQQGNGEVIAGTSKPSKGMLYGALAVGAFVVGAWLLTRGA